MATEDLDNENTSEKKSGKINEEAELQDTGSDKTTGKKNTPVEDETDILRDAGESGNTERGNEIEEVTAQELEEESIDEEETEFLSKDCMCLEQDGDYYCFKLKQGRWIQWSVISYPTKKMCEAACCKT